MKLTAERLSRVLTAHACDGLQRGGSFGETGYPGCLLQVGLELTHIPFALASEEGRAADWFDDHYESTWTVDEFLAQLQRRGLA